MATKRSGYYFRKEVNGCAIEVGLTHYSELLEMLAREEQKDKPKQRKYDIAYIVPPGVTLSSPPTAEELAKCDRVDRTSWGKTA